MNKEGRGPAWANSLFEDNAEFGLGYRLSLDKHREQADGAARGARAAARDGAGRGDPRRAPGHAGRRRRATAAGRGARCGARADGRSAGRDPADAHGAPGPPQRLDRRRRRLGVRHRLRRARSRARLGPQRQHPRARHRGVLEHRRAGLEVHAAWRGREVRRRRQARPQEGPRADGGGLRQRVRRADRDGRVRAADRGRLPRGRSARRPVDHHRLQPLHRPRHQHALRHAAAEARGRLRALAALSLPAGGRRPRARGVRARLGRAVDPVEGVRLQRDPLQDALLHEAGGGQAAPRAGAGGRRSALADLHEPGRTLARGQPARAGRSPAAASTPLVEAL